MNDIPKLLFILAFLLVTDLSGKTLPFTFEYKGNQLRGLVDMPQNQNARSLIIVVHGHGKTDVANGQWGDLRARFPKLGITTVLWDKAGCGDSEGIYDHNQTVEDSANEVLAAIEELKKQEIPGVEKIGLWGISRAGWICPLVIQRVPSIAYWISVSGTDEKESFGYLLESNLRIEGFDETQIDLMLSEWKKGNEVFQKGGSFQEYLESTENLRGNAFWKFVNGAPYTADEFARLQKEFMEEKHEFDESTGLMIYVSEFDQVLTAISCPVLAIFGEKDTSVDWKSTLSLYKNAIRSDLLTVVTFPNGNHNIQESETGGFKEMIANSNRWNPCEGYYKSMTDWLVKQTRANPSAQTTPTSTPH